MSEPMLKAVMRAVRCVDYGPPARLETVETPKPDLPPDHVRVGVHYCGLGIPDLLMMTGRYQFKPVLPFIPGSEIAGVVTEVGANVERFVVGDRVAGLNHTFVGGLAQEAVLPAVTTVGVPSNVPLRIAAAALLNYSTAYYALTERGRLRPNERVLVLGAAGGVGIAAIEIAKALGAHVLAAASTDAKLEIARSHGADACLNYSSQSIKHELKRCGGVDVVVDPVGGVYSEQALRALRPGGRLLVVGFAAGRIPSIALNLPLLKDCSIAGAFLMTQLRNAPARFVANAEGLFDLLADGRLNPPVAELECFGHYASVQRLIGDRARRGKVVMRLGAAVKSEPTQRVPARAGVSAA